MHRLYYFANLLTSKDTFATFKMKQNAINEAFHMTKSEPQS
jgi:hypothetical protein